MLHNAAQTALLIALLFKNSEQNRARVSDKTIKRLSKRKKLRQVFIAQIIAELDAIGLILIELDRGGYGVLPTSALDGAPAITAKKYLTTELDKMRKNKIDFGAIAADLEADLELTEDDES